MNVIIGLPTNSVGGQTSDGLRRLSLLSSVTLEFVTLHGGPVEFRPLRATLCLFYFYLDYVCALKR